MTRRHFQIYTTVCDTMNMTEAAKRLFISQSAVSQAIQELEAQYGVRVFERLSRKLYLTPAGESLLGYARHVLRLYEDIEVEMKAYELNASIRIGASVTVATVVLPELIRQFSEAYPNIQISVHEHNTAAIEAMLLNDTLDVGLVEGDLSSGELKEAPFMTDRLIFVCSPKHPFASKSEILVSDLASEAFIVREAGSGTRKQFEDAMKQVGIAWKASWTCNNAETILNAVSKNLGITVISELAVSRAIQEGQLCPFEVTGLSFDRTFRIAYHRHKYPSKSLLALEHFCLRDRL